MQNEKLVGGSSRRACRIRSPTGDLRGGFCAIPAKIDQKSLNKCGGRIVERAKNTGIVVSSPVTRLSCGAARWGLDIRSDVESVTRFSVIESKIPLKNERRSRCISALPRGAGTSTGGGREGEGGCEGMQGRNAVSPACKNRSSFGAAAQLEFDIPCIRCTTASHCARKTN